jgi:hypothetical protein
LEGYQDLQAPPLSLLPSHYDMLPYHKSKAMGPTDHGPPKQTFLFVSWLSQVFCYSNIKLINSIIAVSIIRTITTIMTMLRLSPSPLLYHGITLNTKITMVIVVTIINSITPTPPSPSFQH